MSEQEYKPIDKAEALARWRKHLKVRETRSEAQLKKYREKRKLAAEKIREGRGFE